MNYLFLVVNVIISLPYAAILLLIPLILFGYKDKIYTRGIIISTIILGLLDAFLTQFVDPSGSIHAFIEPLTITLLLITLFNVSILSSVVMSIATFLIYGFLGLPLNLSISYLVGFVPGNPVSTQPSQVINVLATYSMYLIFAGILMLSYKKDFRILNLRRYKVFNRNLNPEKRGNEIIKLFLLCSFPIFVFIGINYFIYTNSKISGGTNYLYFYFVVNLIMIITAYIIMFILIRKLLKLSFIESEYKLQQSCMKNIDKLIKDLRAQRHGFNNHIQTISALLQSKKLDAAKDYALKMHEVISCKNDVISINNPTLCALLNIKSNYAQNNNVKFEINMSNELSEMNFNAYELVEVLGNVIDNAIEAAAVSEEKDKYVKIVISSNENNYVFNIENSGKTIPTQIIDKIFEEGFTTKDQEPHSHGFGLYICKHILEIYNGTIDVQSINNITNFKIYLPMVMKNEFGLS